MVDWSNVLRFEMSSKLRAVPYKISLLAMDASTGKDRSRKHCVFTAYFNDTCIQRDREKHDDDHVGKIAILVRVQLCFAQSFWS